MATAQRGWRLWKGKESCFTPSTGVAPRCRRIWTSSHPYWSRQLGSVEVWEGGGGFDLRDFGPSSWVQNRVKSVSALSRVSRACFAFWFACFLPLLPTSARREISGMTSGPWARLAGGWLACSCQLPAGEGEMGMMLSLILIHTSTTPKQDHIYLSTVGIYGVYLHYTTSNLITHNQYKLFYRERREF